MGVPVSERKSDQISHISNILIVWLLNSYYPSDLYVLVCVTGTHTSTHE